MVDPYSVEGDITHAMSGCDKDTSLNYAGTAAKKRALAFLVPIKEQTHTGSDGILRPHWVITSTGAPSGGRLSPPATSGRRHPAELLGVKEEPGPIEIGRSVAFLTGVLLCGSPTDFLRSRTMSTPQPCQEVSHAKAFSVRQSGANPLFLKRMFTQWEGLAERQRWQEEVLFPPRHRIAELATHQAGDRIWPEPVP